MKKYLIPAILFGTLVIASSCGETTEKNDSTEVAEEKNEQKFEDNKKEDDREFLVEAASGGLLEVELGKLAQTNAASQAVKDFAQHMVTDHSKANEELMALATSKSISVPSVPGEDHQKEINDLKEKKGADFDKAYMDLMVDDHQKDVDEFEKEANDGNDAEIKAFAAGKVPILKNHLEMAKGARDKVKK